MPRRTELPTYLTSEVERAGLAAELHALADDLEQPGADTEFGQAPPVSRLDRARAERLRSWAGQTETWTGRAPE